MQAKTMGSLLTLPLLLPGMLGKSPHCLWLRQPSLDTVDMVITALQSFVGIKWDDMS